MSHPDLPFDPDDPNFDPWADDPTAPKEPGGPDLTAVKPSSPRRTEDVRQAGPLGPMGLLDSHVRGEIEFEILFQQTRAALERPLTPAPLGWGPVAVLGGLLVVGLIGVWVPRFAGVSAVALAGLVYGVLRLIFARTYDHEPADRRIPFKVAVIRCLPGLVVGSIGLWLLAPPAGFGFMVVLALVLFHLFVLVPLPGLDGNRLVEVTLAARWPWLGTVFRAGVVCSVLACAGLADSWIVRGLAMVASFPVVAGILVTHRQARTRGLMARAYPDLPKDPRTVGRQHLESLFEVALRLRKSQFTPERLAADIREFHSLATTPTFGLLGTALILTGHAMLMAVGLWSVVWRFAG